MGHRKPAILPHVARNNPTVTATKFLLLVLTYDSTCSKSLSKNVPIGIFTCGNTIEGSLSCHALYCYTRPLYTVFHENPQPEYFQNDWNYSKTFCSRYNVSTEALICMHRLA